MPQSVQQFVVLRHEQACGVHWDLMLESGEVLATWRSGVAPADWLATGPGGPLPLIRLPDHRRAYLEYEGPVSGDRGRVSRVEAGTFELLSSGPEALSVRLDGPGMSGLFRLVRLSGSGWELQRPAG